MSYNEQQFQDQARQVDTLKDELSRLNLRFESLMKDNGIKPEDLEQNRADISPALQEELRRAEEEAKRAGAARAAQTAPAQPSAGSLPGSRRRSAIRL